VGPDPPDESSVGNVVTFQKRPPLSQSPTVTRVALPLRSNVLDVGYLVVTFVHTGLFLRSSEESTVRAMFRLGPFNTITAALLLVAGFTSGGLQWALWSAAFGLHWASPVVTAVAQNGRAYVAWGAHSVNETGLRASFSVAVRPAGASRFRNAQVLERIATPTAYLPRLGPALALTGTRTLGIVTPFGGVAFIAGWACLAWGALRSQVSA